MRLLPAALSIAAALVLTAACCLAQTAAPPPVASAGLAPPKSLSDALKTAHWDPADRGPLFVVAPDVDVRPPADLLAGPNGEKPPAPAVPERLPNGEYRVPELGDYYGRRVVQLNGVSVLAPAWTIVLNEDPGKPDLSADLGFEQGLRELEASLTAEQWKKLGSDGGLGRGDLDSDQQALFDAMLPKPFVYTRYESAGMLGGKQGDEIVSTLPDSDRAGIRIRMRQRAYLKLPPQDGSVWYSASLSGQARGAPRISMRTPPFTAIRAGVRFGVALSQMTHSHLKSGELDFDAPVLAPRLPLNGIATVGDLVAHIRQVTRVEIYVDPRLGHLGLWIRAAPDAEIRAGEALKALCWGVSGAIRRLTDRKDTVFVLTDDVAGLGVREGRLLDWEGNAIQARYERQALQGVRIRHANPLNHIHFAPDDPLTPTPAQLAKVAEGRNSLTGRMIGAPIPAADLPASVQISLREAAAEENANRSKLPESDPKHFPVTADTVRMTVMPEVALDIPGVGEAILPMMSLPDMDSFFGAPTIYTMEDDPKPPARPDKIVLSAAERARDPLAATAATPEEARAAIAAARVRGLTQVWIAAPREWEDASSPRADPRQKAVLSEAIAAGKRNGIAVLAIARVSSMPKPDRPAADMDINLFGETETAAVKRALDQAVALGRVTAPFEKNLSDSRDWLIPDAPETVPRIARRLAELAAVPGLAGIVLADAVAPGYRSAEGTDQGNNDEPLGYTMARRIAFVRATGCDPIDITPDHNYGSAIVTPPFFGRTAPSPLAAWMTFRYQAAKRMLGALFPACHPMTAAPGFTVYMESIMEWERGRWYSVWQNPAAPPRAHVGQGDVIDVVTRSIHSDSKRSLYAVRGHDASYTKVASSNDDPPLPSSTVFAHDYQVSSYFVKRFDGCVFDFRDMPLARALDLLTAIPPATAPPPGR